MRAKFGFFTEQPNDSELIADFFHILAECHTDFNDSFQALTLYHETLTNAPADSVDSSETVGADNLANRLVERSASPSDIISSLKRKMRIHKVSMHPNQIMGLWEMLQTRPDDVREMFGGAPLDAVHNEIGSEKSKLDRLIYCSNEMERLQGLSPTVKANENHRRWEDWIKKYLARITIDNNHNTNTQIKAVALQRRTNLMRANNPTFILRNWVAQDAVAAAETGDFSRVRTVLKMLETPYAREFSTFETDTMSTLTDEQKRYTKKSPNWATSLLCTCSS